MKLSAIIRQSILTLLVLSWAMPRVAAESGGKIGVNVVLNRPLSQFLLANLASYGQVLDTVPEIHAVRLKTSLSELSAIQALDYVAAANPDVQGNLLGTSIATSDFSGASNLWNLDAINVTDFDVGHTVDYDGEGVYIAVIDSGLFSNWREYFPEERIATSFARAFSGGGTAGMNISSQPEKWEGDHVGHGTWVTSPILGFAYHGLENLPSAFSGVAPKSTIIPVKVIGNNSTTRTWSSTCAHGIAYLTALKRSGALGNASLIINFSIGFPILDAMMQAAIDHAIANGIIFVAGAGNGGDGGMRYPSAYPPVISSSATGPTRMLPDDDPTHIEWILRDIAENDDGEHFLWFWSSRELEGQDLDIAAPGGPIAVPDTNQGQVDYNYAFGNSLSGPHVAGAAALMLQKNPNLVAGDVEQILEETALPLPPDCREVAAFFAAPGDPPTWSDASNVKFPGLVTYCWEFNATGAGLLQVDAALNLTPSP